VTRSPRRPLRSSRIPRLGLLVCAAAACFSLLAATPAFAATFDPNLVISNDNMRASGSMSASAIQSFLDARTGMLKGLVIARHDGGSKTSAAVIIAEAARAWNISPKVLLTMLQKEQSLLTRSQASLVTGYRSTLDWALGMGCPDSGPRKERYRGFGNQIWYAAQSLSSYGEISGFHGIAMWRPGMMYPTSLRVIPRNIATYKLYVYNPSIGAKAPYGDLSAQRYNLSGNANFWMIYWHYFGSPFANPATAPAYRRIGPGTAAGAMTAAGTGLVVSTPPTSSAAWGALWWFEPSGGSLKPRPLPSLRDVPPTELEISSGNVDGDPQDEILVSRRRDGDRMILATVDVTGTGTAVTSTSRDIALPADWRFDLARSFAADTDGDGLREFAFLYRYGARDVGLLSADPVTLAIRRVWRAPLTADTLRACTVRDDQGRETIVLINEADPKHAQIWSWRYGDQLRPRGVLHGFETMRITPVPLRSEGTTRTALGMRYQYGGASTAFFVIGDPVGGGTLRTAWRAMNNAIAQSEMRAADVDGDRSDEVMAWRTPDRANPGYGAELWLLTEPLTSAAITQLWGNQTGAGWSAGQVGRPSALIPR
jgi:hypothetical protein